MLLPLWSDLNSHLPVGTYSYFQLEFAFVALDFENSVTKLTYI